MKKSTTYYFLILDILVMLLLRIPDSWSNGSSTGSDSHVYHMMVAQSTDLGFFPWIMNISSYFGMYPFTVCSGSLAFLGNLHLVSGISLDNSILIY